MNEENKYRRVDLLALEGRHIDLKVSERILGQTNFIGRGPPADVYGVGLPHHSHDRSGIGPNPRSVECTTRGIDIEPSQYFRGRGIKTEHDLDATVGVLGWSVG